jgi:hypothetical protein
LNEWAGLVFIDCNFKLHCKLLGSFDTKFLQTVTRSRAVRSEFEITFNNNAILRHKPGLGSHFVDLGSSELSTSGSRLSSEKDGRSSMAMDICAKLITTRHGRREGSNHRRVGLHILNFRVESAVILTLTKPAIIGRNPDLWFQ